ncbi:MAG: thioredoxin fold domain-containing protein [Akkermansiaceae bacterium]
MKSLTISLLLSLAAPGALLADCPAHQITDSQTKAAAEKKSVFLVFAGEDWHEPSKKFKEEVLNNAGVRKKLEEHFVIQVLNFPKKTEEADAVSRSLREKYRVSRYPTVLLTDPLGRPYGYTGYRPGGTEAMMETLGKSRELLSKRDAAFAEAFKVKGVPRAKALEKGLRLLPQGILREHYGGELDAIKKADPKGETKLVGEIEKSEALKKERDAYSALFKAKKYDEVVIKSREAAAGEKGEEAQRLSMYAVQALVSQKKYEEANKAIDSMVKLAPESNFGKSGERYKKVIANVKDRDKKVAQAQKSGANTPGKSRKPAKPRGPVVSKPVAVVNDIKTLEDDLKNLQADLAKAKGVAMKATAAENEAAKKIAEREKEIATLEKELKPLKEGQAKRVEEAKKARAEQLRLTKKEKILSEVIANYYVMEKRKREISDLEKKATDLHEKAKELRQKAKKTQGDQ